MSSTSLCNHAPLFMELHLLQGTLFNFYSFDYTPEVATNPAIIMSELQLNYTTKVAEEYQHLLL